MFEIRLRQFIWALSSAADLVGVTDIAHGKRVAFYAEQIFRHLPIGFPFTDNEIIAVGLLHDCGVSSTDVHERLVKEMEWARVSEHCTRGAELLASSSLLSQYAGAVRLHHTRWELFDGSDQIADEAMLANLIFLADRLDVLIATHNSEVLVARKKILEILDGYSGILFNPEFVDSLHKAARTDVFWMIHDESHLRRHFYDWIERETPRQVNAQDLSQLFGIFGRIADAKSRFTGAHSQAVAELCFEIGHKMELDDQSCFRLGLAGLVHDIGKLRIPDDILNKTHDLNEEEFSTIKHHSFDALDILSQLNGFEDVARFSSMHHERLDGSGYPYQLSGQELEVEARILAIADIFQALAQNRPYRAEMVDEQIRCILELEASRGRIDPNIVKKVMESFHDLMIIARQQEPLAL